jgi:uncharacterized membrane protein YfcA
LSLLAWLGAGAVGLTLGLLGSGGSILTVPILVYLLGQEEKTAIGGSLAVVGAIALVGGIAAAARRAVEWRAVVLFGLPGMAGTLAGAAAARAVPGPLQLAVFALFMLAAAVAMLRRAGGGEAPAARRSAARLAADGSAVGLATGFVGIGGGFLIVPALVVLGGLPAALAVGTSLWIIALNALTGFARYLPMLEAQGLRLDWSALTPFILIGSCGSLIGHGVGRRLPQTTLRRLFGGLLLILGAYVLASSAWRLAS